MCGAWRTETIFDSVRENRTPIAPTWDAALGDLPPQEAPVVSA